MSSKDQTLSLVRRVSALPSRIIEIAQQLFRGDEGEEELVWGAVRKISGGDQRAWDLLSDLILAAAGFAKVTHFENHEDGSGKRYRALIIDGTTVIRLESMDRKISLSLGQQVMVYRKCEPFGISVPKGTHGMVWQIDPHEGKVDLKIAAAKITADASTHSSEETGLVTLPIPIDAVFNY